jgi:hypothetical protein
MIRGEFKLIDNNKLYRGQFDPHDDAMKDVFGYILDFNKELPYRPKYFYSAMTKTLITCHVNALYGTLREFGDFDKLIMCLRAVKNQKFRHQNNLITINNDNYTELIDHNDDPLIIRRFVEDALYSHSLYSPGESCRDLFLFCSLFFEIPLIERALRNLEEEGLLEKVNLFNSENRWSYDHKLTQKGLAEIRPRFVHKAVSNIIDNKTKSNKEQYDFFISHASEDKEIFANELAEGLRAAGFEVWYDDFIISWGDSIRQQVEKGLRNSIHGIVLLSHNFFKINKKWTHAELDGLFVLETDEKKILPISLQISIEEISQYSPILAGKLTLKAEDGVDRIIQEARKLMNKEGSFPQITVLSPLQIEMIVRAFRNEGQIHRRPIDQNTNDIIIIGIWGTPTEANNSVFLQYINALEKLKSLDYIERKGPNLYVLKLKGNDEAQRLISEGYKFPE